MSYSEPIYIWLYSLPCLFFPMPSSYFGVTTFLVSMLLYIPSSITTKKQYSTHYTILCWSYLSPNSVWPNFILVFITQRFHNFYQSSLVLLSRLIYTYIFSFQKFFYNLGSIDGFSPFLITSSSSCLIIINSKSCVLCPHSILCIP